MNIYTLLNRSCSPKCSDRHWLFSCQVTLTFKPKNKINIAPNWSLKLKCFIQHTGQSKKADKVWIATQILDCYHIWRTLHNNIIKYPAHEMSVCHFILTCYWTKTAIIATIMANNTKRQIMIMIFFCWEKESSKRSPCLKTMSFWS